MELRRTALGTLCSRRWCDAWIALVESTEAALGHRICGAAANDGAPCEVPSTHHSGRCRFHGGHPGVGAPEGNENARVHGLYQRRLRICGPTCPLWNSCPFAGNDIEQLPEKKRPTCYYEQREYEEMLKHYFKAVPVDDEEATDPVTGLRAYTFRPLDDSAEPFLLQNVMMLQIQISRAAAVLAQHNLTEEYVAESEGFRMKSLKVNPVLDAHTRLVREYRALLGTINTKKLMPPPKPMGLGSRVMALAIKTQGVAEEAYEHFCRIEKEEARKAKEAEAQSPTPE